MTTDAMREGVALFVGWQEKDNSIVRTPSRIYRCIPSAAAVTAARYAGRMGFVSWAGQELFALYFVDPELQHVFAQVEARSGTSLPPERLTFEEARSLVRKAFSGMSFPKKAKAPEKERILAARWADWIDGRDPSRGPLAIDLPRDPKTAYGAEWHSFKDWMVTPKKKGKKPKEKKARAA